MVIEHNPKGFTLIELLIVVAVIGILAAVAIPTFQTYRTKGFNTSALVEIKHVRTALEAFFQDNQGYP